jgi:hypothetical protein
MELDISLTKKLKSSLWILPLSVKGRKFPARSRDMQDDDDVNNSSLCIKCLFLRVLLLTDEKYMEVLLHVCKAVFLFVQWLHISRYCVLLHSPCYPDLTLRECNGSVRGMERLCCMRSCMMASGNVETTVRSLQKFIFSQGWDFEDFSI